MDGDELRRRYAAAPSVRALAREMGVSHAWLGHELKRHGIEVRARRVGHPKPPPTEAERAEWRRRYEEAGSVLALSRELGKNWSTVTYHLKRHGIDVQSTGFKSPKTVVHTGADHSSWKGGTYRRSDGYVYEYAPTHPDASKAKGYVLQHRLVMEAKLGRRLKSTELVHHVNEVKDDNRPENLELYNRSAHMKHHKAQAARGADGRFTA